MQAIRPRTLFALALVVSLAHWLALTPQWARFALSNTQDAGSGLAVRLVTPVASAGKLPPLQQPLAPQSPQSPQSPKDAPKAAIKKPSLKPIAEKTALTPPAFSTPPLPAPVSVSVPVPPPEYAVSEPVTTASSPLKKDENSAITPEIPAQAAPNSIAFVAAVTATTQPPTQPNSQPADTTTPAGDAGAASGERTAVFQFPPSIELGFNATSENNGQPLQGSGSLQWSTQGSAYTLRMQSSAFFVNVLTQISTGNIGPLGIEPTRFSDKRINRSEQAAHFDRNKGRISFSNNRPATALQSGAQDRASVPMQLAALLAGDPQHYFIGRRIQVQVASADEADAWEFIVQQPQLIEVPAGKSMAMRLVRAPRREFDTRLELWFAPNLSYLPVRIRQTEANGNFIDLALRSPTLVYVPAPEIPP